MSEAVTPHSGASLCICSWPCHHEAPAWHTGAQSVQLIALFRFMLQVWWTWCTSFQKANRLACCRALYTCAAGCHIRC